MIKKYSKYIIVFLLVLLLFKNCNSCSDKRQYEYNIKQIEINNSKYVDSLLDVIGNNEYLYDSLLKKNELLKDSLHNIYYENTALKAIISEVKSDKEYYKKQNRNLVNMANNLSKKDTIK